MKLFVYIINWSSLWEEEESDQYSVTWSLDKYCEAMKKVLISTIPFTDIKLLRSEDERPILKFLGEFDSKDFPLYGRNLIVALKGNVTWEGEEQGYYLVKIHNRGIVQIPEVEEGEVVCRALGLDINNFICDREGNEEEF